MRLRPPPRTARRAAVRHAAAGRARPVLRLAVLLAAAVPPAVPPAAGAAPAAAPGVPAAAAPAHGTAAWSTEILAPGVRVRAGTLTDPAAAPSWTVTVQAPATSRLTGAPTWAAVGTAGWARTTAGRLRDAGFAPRLETVRWPGYADTPHGTMGTRVRVGSHPTQAAAQAAAAALAAAGFHAVAEWTGYDAEQPADVEHVHVAVVDPRAFTGTVRATHDGDVTRRGTTSSVAAELGALAAVNGGFFVTSDADGVQGVPAGISASGGELTSMAAGSRAALVLGDGGRRNRVANLSTTVTARASGGGSYAVQGVDRVPGLVRDCGRPGGVPSARPWQDVTCRLADDLVLFTPAFGAELPAGEGAQAVLDHSGRVVATGGRGGRVPAGGRVLQGTGRAAGWLAAHARPCTRIAVDEDVRDAAGHRLRLGARDTIVSAAPVLVRDGRVAIDAAAEGTVDPADPSFGYAWSGTRQPRTMAGVDRAGRLLLVTVDGRRAGGSEGFTLREAADFMRSLGAVQALNLDGGGSTAMAVRGALANHPSDAAGERAVGDTVQVLPGPRASGGRD